MNFDTFSIQQQSEQHLQYSPLRLFLCSASTLTGNSSTTSAGSLHFHSFLLIIVSISCSAAPAHFTGAAVIILILVLIRPQYCRNAAIRFRNDPELAVPCPVS